MSQQEGGVDSPDTATPWLKRGHIASRENKPWKSWQGKRLGEAMAGGSLKLQVALDSPAALGKGSESAHICTKVQQEKPHSAEEPSGLPGRAWSSVTQRIGCSILPGSKRTSGKGEEATVVLVALWRLKGDLCWLFLWWGLPSKGLHSGGAGRGNESTPGKGGKGSQADRRIFPLDNPLNP